MKREFLLFWGQNVSYGTPNEKTGRYSFYGCFYKFDDIKTREEFIRVKTGFKSGEIVKTGSRKTLRKFDLGCTLQNYNDFMDCISTTYINEFGEFERDY